MTTKSSSQLIEPVFSSIPTDTSLPQSHIVLVGEDAEHYSRIEHQMTQSVNPTDIFERLWIRDMTDLVWDSLRLRRIKGDLLQSATPRRMKEVLADRMRATEANLAVSQWLTGDAIARAGFDNTLKAFGLSIDAIRTEANIESIQYIEKIDRFIANVDLRRNMIHREVGRHRDAMATRLARASAAIEDAEFAEIESNDKQRPIQNDQPK